MQASSCSIAAVFVRMTEEVIVSAFLTALVRLINAIGFAIAQPATGDTQQSVMALEFVRSAGHRLTGWWFI